MEELVGALAPAVVDALEALGEAHVSGSVVEQALLVGHMVEEMLDVLFLELAGLDLDVAADVFAELLAAELAAGEADDREARGQLLLGVEADQCREELAAGEVAGHAEDHEYGRIHER